MRITTALRACLAVILLMIADFVAVPDAQRIARPTPARPERRIAPPTTQRIYTPLPAGMGRDATLVLNNNSSGPIAITPLLYREGHTSRGRALTLRHAEVRWLTLADLRIDNASLDTIDGIELKYVGKPLEVGAQITIVRGRDAGSLDVMFSAPMDYRSSIQEAVWPARAGMRSWLFLGNPTDVPVLVSLEHGSSSHTIELGAGVARTIPLPETHDDTQAAGSSTVSSARLSVQGPPGSVRAAGFVEAQGRFSGSIRFYDAAMARQPHLFATNLRVGGASPAMALKNTSDTSVTVTPRFHPVDESGPPFALPPLTLPARTAKSIDLGSLVAAAAERRDLTQVSVEVLNDGPPGSVIGGLVAFGARGAYNYDVPLRDSGFLRQSTGSYPWRIDGDYRSLISVTNVGPVPATLLARIVYPGGVYYLPADKISLGGTVIVDVRQLRDEQVPDAHGRVLPRQVQAGQFRWSMLGREPSARLAGRTEMVSAMAGISSTYSCPVCCPDDHGWGFTNPGAPMVNLSDQRNIDVYEQLLDCYNNPSFTLAGSVSTSWWVADSNVTAVDMISAGLARADGVGEGSSDTVGTWDSFYYDDDGMDCYYNGTSAYVEPEVTVVCAQPILFQQANAYDAGGGVLHFQYDWGSSSGNLGDLSQCEVGERVDYAWFHVPFPAPFPDWTPANPTEVSVNGAYGSMNDDHWPGLPGSPFRTPYTFNTMTASQIYRYKCPCAPNQWITLMGPLDINRSVLLNGNGTYRYEITKGNGFATINPLP
jgi:hypothetical protein